MAAYGGVLSVAAAGVLRRSIDYTRTVFTEQECSISHIARMLNTVKLIHSIDLCRLNTRCNISIMT